MHRHGDQGFWRRIAAWWDSEALASHDGDEDHRIDWARVLPFLALHLACFAVFWAGVSIIPLVLALVLFYLRMFAITAVYHRLLAHRSFSAPRWLIVFGAALANSSAQRGPLWWAAHHRHHHRHSDQDQDLHRPDDGVLESHLFWFLRRSAYRTRLELLPDWRDQRALRWLDRYDVLSPMLLALATFALGLILETWWPALGATAWQCFLWGFCVSTVACFHATFTINSLAHRWGRRRFETGDQSRNNLFLALLTMGEGWHNNHHHYQASARQGFYWYEIDLTWYLLLLLERFGLVADLRGVPAAVYARARS